MAVSVTRQTDLSLTDEQQDFVRSIRDFAERELAGDRLAALTNGFEDVHSHELARKMAELGWYGLTIDEEYGGSGGTFLGAGPFLQGGAPRRPPGAGRPLPRGGSLPRGGPPGAPADRRLRRDSYRDRCAESLRHRGAEARPAR